MPNALDALTDEELLKLLETKSSRELARELNVSRNAVIGRGWRARQKLSTLGPPEMPKAPPKPKAPPPPKAPEMPKVRYEPKAETVAALGLLEPENPVDLDGLRHYHCRWPIDRDESPLGGYYCGAPKVRGSYCEGHAKVAYKPIKAKRLRSDSSASP